MSIFKKKAGYTGHSLQYPPNNMLHEHTHEGGTMDDTSIDEGATAPHTISNTHQPVLEEVPVQAQASVQVPVPTPVQVPAQAPVQLPAQEPVQTTVQVPVQAPVEMQVQVPTLAPVQPMIQPETPAPIPTTSPDVLQQPASQPEAIQVQREVQVHVQPPVQPVVNQAPVQVEIPVRPQIIPSLGVQPQAPAVPKSARKAPGASEDGLIGLTVRIDPVLYARIKKTAKSYNIKLAKVVEALIRDYCPEG